MMTQFEKYYKIFDSVGYGQQIFVRDLEAFLEKQDNKEDYFGLIFNFRYDKKVKLIEKKSLFGAKFQILSDKDDPDELYYLDGHEILKKDIISEKIKKEENKNV